jgi:hypothetical protein
VPGQQFVMRLAVWPDWRARTSASQARGVDVVELGAFHQGIHGGGAAAALVGAGEGPIPAARRCRAGRSAALLLRQMRPSSRKRVKAGQRFSR